MNTRHQYRLALCSLLLAAGAGGCDPAAEEFAQSGGGEATSAEHTVDGGVLSQHASEESQSSALVTNAGGEHDIYGGRGGAMWTWTDRYSIGNLRTVGWDRLCNAEGIYGFARVHDHRGFIDIGRVDDKDGCRGGHWERNGMRWFNGRGRIQGVTSFVCRDKSGVDECVGQYYGNPYP